MFLRSVSGMLITHYEVFSDFLKYFTVRGQLKKDDDKQQYTHPV
jgi:hypothetical protein